MFHPIPKSKLLFRHRRNRHFNPRFNSLRWLRRNRSALAGSLRLRRNRLRSQPPNPTAWVPMSPPQEASVIPAKPIKKAVKKKTRKLTDIESEALIREARVYLETDLQKASEVYQQIIENPVSAEVVANDLTSYLEQDPASPQLWNLLGDACSRAGRFQDAYRAYAEALRRM